MSIVKLNHIPADNPNMSGINLPPKHRILKKYSNEVLSRPIQLKANLPSNLKNLASLILQETASGGNHGQHSSSFTLQRLHANDSKMENKPRSPSSTFYAPITPATPASPVDEMVIPSKRKTQLLTPKVNGHIPNTKNTQATPISYHYPFYTYPYPAYTPYSAYTPYTPYPAYPAGSYVYGGYNIHTYSGVGIPTYPTANPVGHDAGMATSIMNKPQNTDIQHTRETQVNKAQPQDDPSKTENRPQPEIHLPKVEESKNENASSSNTTSTNSPNDLSTPSTPPNTTERYKQSSPSSKSLDSSTREDSPPTTDDQPHCCILDCTRPVSDRSRHSLLTYTSADCYPEFLEKQYDRVCNFHYFRDKYLFRKQNGESPTPGTPEDESKEISIETTLKRKRDDKHPTMKRARESNDTEGTDLDDSLQSSSTTVCDN